MANATKKKRKKHRGIQEREGKDGIFTFRAQVRLRGKYITESFPSLEKALAWIEKTRTTIREGKFASIISTHTFGDLIDRYIADVLPTKKKCEKAQKTQLLWWKSQLGMLSLTEITRDAIGRLRDKLSKEITTMGRIRTPATVNRYLAALSHAFTKAVDEWGWLDNSPMSKVTKPKESRGRVRYLSPEDLKRLLNACNESSNHLLKIVVILAVSTGMRQGEIMNLRWMDVDLVKKRAILQNTKNGERRSVPIAGLALQALLKLNQERKSEVDLLFPSKEDSQYPIDLRFPWEKALRISGISDFRFHDLRHTAASYMAMNGASLLEIAEVLGHKTLAMVKRYAHLCESHTAKVVARMNDAVFGENTMGFVFRDQANKR